LFLKPYILNNLTFSLKILLLPPVMEDKKLTLDQIKKITEGLEHLLAHGEQLKDIPEMDKRALLIAAGKLSRPTKEELQIRAKNRRKSKKNALREQDRILRKNTGIRSVREADIFTAPMQKN